MQNLSEPLSGWRDLNSRPLDPQSSTLTGLRHTPKSARKDKNIRNRL